MKTRRRAKRNSNISCTAIFAAVPATKKSSNRSWRRRRKCAPDLDPTNVQIVPVALSFQGPLAMLMSPKHNLDSRLKRLKLSFLDAVFLPPTRDQIQVLFRRQ